MRLLNLAPLRRGLATAASNVQLNGRLYAADSVTNVPAAILEKAQRRLYKIPNHPIGILSHRIASHFAHFANIDAPDPVVSVAKNFDELGFEPDHPGRRVTDSYYLNKDTLLRTHTSAHEIETFRNPAVRDAWLLTADVYRRDEIDRSHYPVFHQMEGARLFDASADLRALEDRIEHDEHALRLANVRIHDESRVGEVNPFQHGHDPALGRLVVRDLKLALNGLMLDLFASDDGKPLEVRWIDSTFPFTSPSFEVEVLWNDEWLEVLGSGMIMQRTLDTAGVPDKVGWAFGLGLERIAMVLFSIPDIRLFWSTDSRFLAQFSPGKFSPFKPYSRYPECKRDTSFWHPPMFHENDFCDIVRDVAGDLAEDVQLVDQFVHPKTQRSSATYRINYRSMDKSLTNEEVNEMHAQVIERATRQLGVEVR
ncbi:phenylalanyl-tRNA synthetase [Exidia glandulosa HHB12029]|uniref:Phenylalanine--tRNA ligase, mitochondrial n=1 Tax=Exidia glandulosa HHB12029 TaxID=1314781 RepID=A0A165IGH7_EXIGL|nr:phenylalanyl-tRNA synthetase [Exidia glandulosa HHB12029]